MKYQKHNLYTGEYDLTDHGVCTPPEDSEWAVLAVVGEHEGGGQFLPVEGETETICLVLQDEGFWPVMSFITHTEARILAHTLLEAVGQE